MARAPVLGSGPYIFLASLLADKPRVLRGGAYPSHPAGRSLSPPADCGDMCWYTGVYPRADCHMPIMNRSSKAGV